MNNYYNSNKIYLNSTKIYNKNFISNNNNNNFNCRTFLRVNKILHKERRIMVASLYSRMMGKEMKRENCKIMRSQGN